MWHKTSGLTSSFANSDLSSITNQIRDMFGFGTSSQCSFTPSKNDTIDSDSDEDEMRHDDWDAEICFGTMRGNIVGIQHYHGTEAMDAEVTVNNTEMVALQREPHNEYDCNAIRVNNMNGIELGHIERELAKPLAYISDRGLARIEGVVPCGGYNMHSMPVDLTLWGLPQKHQDVVDTLKQYGYVMTGGASLRVGCIPGTSQSVGMGDGWKNPRWTYLTPAEAKNELDKLFENIKEEDKTSITEPAEAIGSNLYTHQKQALNWMIQRENGSCLPPFWEECGGKYFNSITNFTFKNRPRSVQGGILADDMGLGKTLEMIALILTNFKDNKPLAVCVPDRKSNKTKLMQVFKKDEVNLDGSISSDLCATAGGTSDIQLQDLKFPSSTDIPSQGSLLKLKDLPSSSNVVSGVSEIRIKLEPPERLSRELPSQKIHGVELSSAESNSEANVNMTKEKAVYAEHQISETPSTYKRKAKGKAPLKGTFVKKKYLPLEANTKTYDASPTSAMGKYEKHLQGELPDYYVNGTYDPFPNPAMVKCKTHLQDEMQDLFVNETYDAFPNPAMVKCEKHLQCELPDHVVNGTYDPFPNPAMVKCETHLQDEMQDLFVNETFDAFPNPAMVKCAKHLQGELPDHVVNGTYDAFPNPAMVKCETHLQDEIQDLFVNETFDAFPNPAMVKCAKHLQGELPDHVVNGTYDAFPNPAMVKCETHLQDEIQDLFVNETFDAFPNPAMVKCEKHLQGELPDHVVNGTYDPFPNPAMVKCETHLQDEMQDLFVNETFDAFPNPAMVKCAKHLQGELPDHVVNGTYDAFPNPAMVKCETHLQDEMQDLFVNETFDAFPNPAMVKCAKHLQGELPDHVVNGTYDAFPNPAMVKCETHLQDEMQDLFVNETFDAFPNPAMVKCAKHLQGELPDHVVNGTYDAFPNPAMVKCETHLQDEMQDLFVNETFDAFPNPAMVKCEKHLQGELPDHVVNGTYDAFPNPAMVKCETHLQDEMQDLFVNETFDAFPNPAMVKCEKHLQGELPDHVVNGTYDAFPNPAMVKCETHLQDEMQDLFVNETFDAFPNPAMVKCEKHLQGELPDHVVNGTYDAFPNPAMVKCETHLQDEMQDLFVNETFDAFPNPAMVKCEKHLQGELPDHVVNGTYDAFPNPAMVKCETHLQDEMQDLFVNETFDAFPNPAMVKCEKHLQGELPNHVVNGTYDAFPNPAMVKCETHLQDEMQDLFVNETFDAFPNPAMVKCEKHLQGELPDHVVNGTYDAFPNPAMVKCETHLQDEMQDLFVNETFDAFPNPAMVKCAKHLQGELPDHVVNGTYDAFPNPAMVKCETHLQDEMQDLFVNETFDAFPNPAMVKCEKHLQGELPDHVVNGTYDAFPNPAMVKCETHLQDEMQDLFVNETFDAFPNPAMVKCEKHLQGELPDHVVNGTYDAFPNPAMVKCETHLQDEMQDLFVNGTYGAFSNPVMDKCEQDLQDELPVLSVNDIDNLLTCKSKWGKSSGRTASKGPRTTLIVCPLSVISNWQDQLKEHVHKSVHLDIYLYYGAGRIKDNTILAKKDIVLTTYSTLSADHRKGDSPLEKVEWLRIVLDEGHAIKNPNAKQTKAILALSAQRKWILTGTPIQNSMTDLWSLVNFLQISPFTDQQWWRKTIERPLERGDESAFKRIQHLMSHIALRRTKTQKVKDKPLIELPERKVYLEHISLSGEERAVYDAMQNEGKLIVSEYFMQGTVLCNYGYIFAILMRLRQLCLHPFLVVKATTAIKETRDSRDSSGGQLTHGLQEKLIDTLITVLNSGSDEECAICLDSLKSPVITHCAHVFCKPCIEAVIKKEMPASKCPMCRADIKIEKLVEMPSQGINEECRQQNQTGEWKSSSKVDALMYALLQLRSEDPTVKSIVVSQFTSFLTVLEIPLSANGFKFVRLIGSMNTKARTRAMEEFNDNSPGSPTIILLSLKAGGVGINLTAASRVFLLDPAWNPASEEQCFDRCHRLGQTKEVIITKFIVDDSIETKIIELQERKRQLMQRAFVQKQSAEEKRQARIRDIRTFMDL